MCIHILPVSASAMMPPNLVYITFNDFLTTGTLQWILITGGVAILSVSVVIVLICFKR